MSARLPWLAFDVVDWRMSERVLQLSARPRLMYLELIFSCWLNGSVANPPMAELTLCGFTTDEWDTVIWPALDRLKLITKRNGRLHQPRVQTDRARALARYRKFSEGGRRGGLASHRDKKVANDSGLETSLAQANLEPSQSLPQGKSGRSDQIRSQYIRSEERENARARGSSIIGRNRHLDHSWCGETLTHCVPRAVHDKLADRLAPKYGGDRDATKQYLLSWYESYFKTLPPEHVMPGDAFRFWDAAFQSTFAAPLPTGSAEESIEAQAERMRARLAKDGVFDPDDPLERRAYGRR